MAIDTIDKKTADTASKTPPKYCIKLVSHSPPQWQFLIWSTDYDRWTISATYQTREVALLAMRAKALNQPMSIPPAEFFDDRGEPTPEHPRRRFY